MAEAATFSNLIELSKIDAALARIYAERKKLEATIKEKRQQLQKIENEQAGIQKSVNDKRTYYQREEKSIREERDRLTTRRKEISTLNNYKVQQAAEREIEHAGRQLSAREEPLLVLLDETGKLEAALNVLADKAASVRADLEKTTNEVRQTLATLEERESEYQAKREELANQIDASIMTQYNRVKDKYPMDPLVPVRNHTCSGCFMQLGPQTTLQIMRGQGIIKCRGCARILYLEEGEGNAAKASPHQP